MFLSLACVKEMPRVTEASLEARVMKTGDVSDSYLLFILWQCECDDYVLKSNDQGDTIS